MIRIYRLKYFNIYSNKKGGFIVHNINKEFQNGHTHINNYNTAKYIIQVALHKSLPNTKSVYIIDSLIRISNDNTYINELKNLKEKTITEKQNERKSIMTELDESIFNILKYSGGKIVLNDDELKLQIPRYNNTEDYSNMIKKNNDLKNKVRDIASLLKCNVSINADYRIDTLPFVVKMRKYANGIVESNYGFTYYILDKSKIDWMKIDNIFETLSQALEHKIIDKDAYNFIITKLHYRVDIGELNIK